MIKDIFELAKEEKEKKISLTLAIRDICQKDKWRNKIAGALYSAVYGYEEDHHLFTTGAYEPKETLDRFCKEVFGASFQDVVDAYDKYLG